MDIPLGVLRPIALLRLLDDALQVAVIVAIEDKRLERAQLHVAERPPCLALVLPGRVVDFFHQSEPEVVTGLDIQKAVEPDALQCIVEHSLDELDIAVLVSYVGGARVYLPVEASGDRGEAKEHRQCLHLFITGYTLVDLPAFAAD